MDDVNHYIFIEFTLDICRHKHTLMGQYSTGVKQLTPDQQQISTYDLRNRYINGWNVVLQVTDRLAFLLRNMSDLENNVVSLERIKEYSNVEQEVRP